MLSWIIEFLGAMSLFVAISQLASNRLNLSIKIYQVQSIFLTLSIFTVGIAFNSFELYLSALFNIIIKVFLIPYFLFKIVEKIKIDREVHVYIGITNSLLISVPIVIFSFYITRKIHIPGDIVSLNLLPMSIGILFIGIFIMISRKKAISQIIGFLTFENGIMLAGTSITKGMPLIVETGVFFDVFVGVLMAGVFVYHIRETSLNIDTSKLSNLRE